MLILYKTIQEQKALYKLGYSAALGLFDLHSMLSKYKPNETEKELADSIVLSYLKTGFWMISIDEPFEEEGIIAKLDEVFILSSESSFRDVTEDQIARSEIVTEWLKKTGKKISFLSLEQLEKDTVEKKKRKEGNSFSWKKKDTGVYSKIKELK